MLALKYEEISVLRQGVVERRQREGGRRETRREGKGREREGKGTETETETERSYKKDMGSENRRKLAADVLGLNERSGLLVMSPTKELLRKILHKLQRWGQNWGQPRSGIGRLRTDTLNQTKMNSIRHKTQAQ